MLNVCVQQSRGVALLSLGLALGCTHSNEKSIEHRFTVLEGYDLLSYSFAQTEGGLVVSCNYFRSEEAPEVLLSVYPNIVIKSIRGGSETVQRERVLNSWPLYDKNAILLTPGEWVEFGFEFGLQPAKDPPYGKGSQYRVVSDCAYDYPLSVGHKYQISFEICQDSLEQEGKTFGEVAIPFNDIAVDLRW